MLLEEGYSATALFTTMRPFMNRSMTGGTLGALLVADTRTLLESATHQTCSDSITL
jgi:hypothetical protein